MENFWDDEFNEDDDSREKERKLKKFIESLSDESFDFLQKTFKDGDAFIQDLDDEEANKTMKTFIEENNMQQKIEIIDEEENQYVVEIWTTENELISLKRMYELSLESVSKLDKKTQHIILTKYLDILVNQEKYEYAAIVRDRIKTINK